MYMLALPGLGSLDNWLPVVINLKNTSPKLVFILTIPNPSTVSTINNDYILTKIADTLFDKVMFKTYSGQWLSVEKLSKAKQIGSTLPIIEFTLRISRRLDSGYLSKYYVFRVIALLLKNTSFLIERIRISKKYNSLFVDIEKLDPMESAILYDVTTENKDSVSDFMGIMRKTKKFSIRHGAYIDTITDNTNNKCIDKNRDDVKEYLSSSISSKYYESIHCINKNNIHTVGITKHDKLWVNKILKEESHLVGTIVFDKYVFLIGRPIAEYLPIERKIKTLINIKKVLIDELNLKVVVKLHPKEKIEGFGVDVYSKVFGKENYGIKWQFSSLNPFTIGINSIFSISFFSTVCLDMVSIGTPVIECLDMIGIDNFDNNTSLRNKDGEPVFAFQYYNLVYGAKNQAELRKHSLSILKDRSKALSVLTKEYNSKFTDNYSSSIIVASDIISSI